MSGRFPFLDDDELARRMRGLADGGAAAGPVGSGPAARIRSAEIVLDSAFDQLDPLRSAAALDGRQVVARTDELTVVVDLCRDGEEWVLTGQVVEEADGIGPVVVQFLDEHGSELGVIVVGADGEFECSLSARPCEVIVACESGDIVIELPDPER